MPGAIEANVRTVREHYDSLFNLVDRSKMYEAEGFTQRPPIVNMGFWTRGAKSAREAQEQFVRELASRAEDLEGKHVLDAGCGLGGPATILACDYNAIVDGVNIVDQQVRWARRFADGNGVGNRVRVHLASAMDLPFADASFDVVFCLEAAHCFIDKLRFLRECHRVLRRGGRMVFADIVGTSHFPVVNWQPALKLNLITVGLDKAVCRRRIHRAGKDHGRQLGLPGLPLVGFANRGSEEEGHFRQELLPRCGAPDSGDNEGKSLPP